MVNIPNEPIFFVGQKLFLMAKPHLLLFCSFDWFYPSTFSIYVYSIIITITIIIISLFLPYLLLVIPLL